MKVWPTILAIVVAYIILMGFLIPTDEELCKIDGGHWIEITLSSGNKGHDCIGGR